MWKYNQRKEKGIVLLLNHLLFQKHPDDVLLPVEHDDVQRGAGGLVGREPEPGGGWAVGDAIHPPPSADTGDRLAQRVRQGRLRTAGWENCEHKVSAARQIFTFLRKYLHSLKKYSKH